MIEKLRHDYQFDESTFSVECDDCGESEEIDGQFDDCVDFMRENGWKSFKDEDGDWVNLCNVCKLKPENQ